MNCGFKIHLQLPYLHLSCWHSHRTFSTQIKSLQITSILPKQTWLHVSNVFVMKRLSVFLYCILMCRWEDLAVGAPEFFVKDGFVGGAVYIYINNNGKNWEKIIPTQLLGRKDSMFGLAVENIGDINQDGYGGCDVLRSNISCTKLTVRK